MRLEEKRHACICDVPISCQTSCVNCSQAEARARREAEGEDAEHPDETEVPLGVSARVRFQKYK